MCFDSKSFFSIFIATQDKGIAVSVGPVVVSLPVAVFQLIACSVTVTCVLMPWISQTPLTPCTTRLLGNMHPAEMHHTDILRFWSAGAEFGASCMLLQ